MLSREGSDGWTRFASCLPIESVGGSSADAERKIRGLKNEEVLISCCCIARYPDLLVVPGVVYSGYRNNGIGMVSSIWYAHFDYTTGSNRISRSSSNRLIS